MAESDHIRVEIAFEGGQLFGAVVSVETADELERALGTGEQGGLTLEASDGRYTIALHKVVYAKRFARESRVGFGSS